MHSLLEKFQIRLFTIALSVFSSAAMAATSLDIEVPTRTSGTVPIRDLELFVDLPLTTTGNVQINLTRSTGTPSLSPTPTLNFTSGSSNTDQIMFFPDDAGASPPREDEITVYSNLNDDAHKRFKVLFQLNTNWIEATCGVRQTNAETWSISATSGGTPLDIKGACLNSYDMEPGSTSCARHIMQDSNVPDNDPARISPAPSIPSITPCEDERQAVQAMLVLDKSGSMSLPVMGSGTNSGKTKIVALQDAVIQFVDLWNGTLTKPDDKLGVVLFNHAAQNWAVIPAPELHPFDSALRNLIVSNVGSINAGGATSIGNGLELAANTIDANASANARRVILLMSDGMQNTQRLVAADPITGDVYTHNSDFSGRQSLAGLDKLNIWSVSVGAAGSDIDPAIFQQIADTGLGFYINSEVSADELNLFFLELLQNFLRFNTIETTSLVDDAIPVVHMGSGSVGHKQLNVATTSTAKAISFSLMWDKSKPVEVSMKITPPKGEPINGEMLEHGPGYIRFTSKLPLGEPYANDAQTGEWKIDVGVQGSHVSNPFPIQFYSLADDDIVKAKFHIASKDYVTGDAIPLQVNLSEFRKPLNNQKGKVSVTAKLVKPESGIGNVLSNTAATEGETDSTADPQSPEQQKLQLLSQENANLLGHLTDSVQLFDDGLAIHGDETADDGIFSNLYTKTEKQGNYNFLFTVSGLTNASGPINRQHLETIYVRLQPDPSSSEFSVAKVTDADQPYFNVSLKPRDRFGNLMGPGYANYFVVAPVNGVQYKFQDKDLNGVYTLKIPAVGNQQLPDVDIRYVKPFLHVSDAMYPDKIPENLLEPFPVNGGKRQRSLSFHLGTNVPHGAFNQNYSGKAGLAIDYEQQWRGLNSMLFFAGTNAFSGNTSDVDIGNVSFNLKRYNQPLQLGVLRFFANLGLGYYFANPGDDDVGMNLGGGASFALDNVYELSAWYNYHHIFSSPDTTDFSTLQFGVHYHF